MSEKLVKIRQLMTEYGLAAYLVPHNDPHMSEYVSDRDERIKFISGFSGSSGICLITHENAFMWTDGRYWTQAGIELEVGWELKRMRHGDDPLWFEWSKSNLKEGDIIGFDPYLVTQNTIEERQKFLDPVGVKLQAVDKNLVDTIWGCDQPEWSVTCVSIHSEEFTGRSVSQNMTEIMQKVEEIKGEAILITKLDEIAWLTNLRGQDISYNPLFFSYAIKDKKNVEEYLKDNNIEIAPYLQIFDDLSVGEFKDLKFVMDASECNYKVYSSINKDNITDVQNLIGVIKFVKNETQIKGYRSSQIRDAAALVKFLAWLENELTVKGSTITEYEGSLELEKFRASQDLFMGLSFGTILSTGANGAIIHYHPTKEKSAVLNPREVILCDSGGHYLDGTTDTTRTVHFTEATEFQKEMYTRVLKGNLDFERVKIPDRKVYTAIDIDVLARCPLWQVGLNYNHGTGHGVGHFLNVHEGPRGLYLRAGMTYTDEPGFYKEGEFGIRIENLLILQEDKDISGFLVFDNVTKVPYCRNLINTKYLTPVDVEYINKYHDEVRELLTPLLQDDELALKYLEKETTPL